MSMWLFATMLGLLGIGYLVVGAVASKQEGKGEGYFLAKRELGVFSLALSIMATQLGGGTVMGTCAEAVTAGWAVYCWPLGIGLGLVALGLGLGGRLRRTGAATIAELFEKVYRSRPLRLYAAFLSVISLFLILVAQLLASRAFLAALGIDNFWIFAGIWLVVIGYTVMGGLRAVVYTDVLQTFVIVIAIGVAAGLAFWAAPAVTLQTVDAAPSGVAIGWLVMPFLFMVIGQDMGQRCFAGRDERTVSRAFLYGGLGIGLFGLLPVGLGVLASSLEITEGNPLLGVTAQLTNPTVSALVACGVLIAIVSTADSLICAISSNLAQDFGGRPSRRLCQVLTLLVGIGAMGCSLLPGSIASWQMLAYELSMSALAVPILAALLLPARAGAAWASVAVGTAFFLLPFSGPLFSLSASALAYGVGWLASSKGGRKIVQT